MLIIGFGVTEVLLSTLVFTCETCGNHAAHQLTKQNRKFSLFFIPLFSVGAKYFDSCTACGRIIEVNKEQAETAARRCRTCGDSAKAFTSGSRSADQRPSASSKSNLMGGVGQRVRMHNGFKIHRTTAATFLRRYAGLSAHSSTTGFAVRFGPLPPDGIVCNTKPRAVAVQAATADKASSR